MPDPCAPPHPPTPAQHLDLSVNPLGVNGGRMMADLLDPTITPLQFLVELRLEKVRQSISSCQGAAQAACPVRVHSAAWGGRMAGVAAVQRGRMAGTKRAQPWCATVAWCAAMVRSALLGGAARVAAVVVPSPLAQGG